MQANGIDLTLFCAGHWDGRTHLQQPWQEEGATFATNGFIAIKVHGADGTMPGPHESMVGRIPALLEAASGTIPLDIVLPGDAAEQCPCCRRSGYVQEEKCGECDGGEFTHGSHGYTCKECDGEGSISYPSRQEKSGAVRCFQCDGHGYRSRYLHLESGGKHPHCFQEKFLRLIVGLPGVRLLVSEDLKETARFEFDGGAGLIMPCRV